ncbi:MAG: hypothetical protein HC851_15780 [Acaryochloris sp. RU_4_1]|nr:hypothetical protein [Acaryochloris sp. RU_4_1]NJR57139.1 hypothetical protein [Acaryochloris sp. CRU_2_0]
MDNSLPKSLSKLLDNIPSEQQNYVLEARKQILGSDDRIIEVGRTTSTLYGLRKGESKVYKTLLCAQIIPFAIGVYRPRLMLFLPYPKREWAGPSSGRTYKREKVKGLTWVEASHIKAWDQDSQLRLFFYIGKTRSRHSFCMDIPPEESLFDIIDLALYEWKLRVDEKTQ